MEDSYSMDYSSNSRGISSVARELEILLTPLPDAPISRRGTEGALSIDPGISPLVSILGDSEIGSREICTSLQ